jgi:hypothetical protein
MMPKPHRFWCQETMSPKMAGLWSGGWIGTTMTPWEESWQRRDTCRSFVASNAVLRISSWRNSSSSRSIATCSTTLTRGTRPLPRGRRLQRGTPRHPQATLRPACPPPRSWLPRRPPGWTWPWRWGTARSWERSTGIELVEKEFDWMAQSLFFYPCIARGNLVHEIKKLTCQIGGPRW